MNNTDDACSICLDSLKMKNTIKTACGHRFHSSCMRNWTKKDGKKNHATTCPLCRNCISTIPIFENGIDEKLLRKIYYIEEILNLLYLNPIIVLDEQIMNLLDRIKHNTFKRKNGHRIIKFFEVYSITEAEAELSDNIIDEDDDESDDYTYDITFENSDSDSD